MRDKILYLICFSIIFTVLFSDFYIKDAPDIFEEQVGDKVEFRGVIVDEPDIRENNQKLVVFLAPQGLALNSLKARPSPAKTKVLVTVGFDEDFKYGDEINVKGKLEKPENFITDAGKEFDYINYLKKDDIYYLLNYADIEIISRDNGNIIKSILFSFKEKFLEKINFTILQPESLLMGGLILGEKASFSSDLRQKFVDTGTIHIVALSGYNITIVAEWFMKLFAFLPQRLGMSVGIFSIILFILMTGGASTAVRAGIMAVLVLIARSTGRTYDVGRALILTAVVMIMFNPMVLRYDVSFQLSFIATVGVIYLTPKIEKYFLWVTKRFGLRDIFSITTSAYIFVLPFILYKMGNLSLVAIPANILILPFIPITMLLGFLTGFVGLFWHMLAIPFGYISYLLLHYELGVINVFSNIPFASFTIPDFPLIFVIIIYIYFIYILFGRSIKDFFSFER